MTTTKRQEQNVITVGSATAYIMEFTGTLPETTAICVDANRFGYTKNGATVRYTQTVEEVKDDLGQIRKTILSEDAASIQLGMFGWNGVTIEKMVSTASATTSGGVRTTEIGGVSNDNGKRYVLCLHHEDPLDGDVWWMGVGRNTEGLELAYQQSEGTVAQPTFTCEPYDSTGRLLKYIEEVSTSETTG